MRSRSGSRTSSRSNLKRSNRSSSKQTKDTFRMTQNFDSSMETLSRLVLGPDDGQRQIERIDGEKLKKLVDLASLNHVIVRGLEKLRPCDTTAAEQAAGALAEERARVENAVEHLSAVCAAFEEAGYDVTV